MPFKLLAALPWAMKALSAFVPPPPPRSNQPGPHSFGSGRERGHPRQYRPTGCCVDDLSIRRWVGRWVERAARSWWVCVSPSLHGRHEEMVEVAGAPASWPAAEASVRGRPGILGTTPSRSARPTGADAQRRLASLLPEWG